MNKKLKVMTITITIILITTIFQGCSSSPDTEKKQLVIWSMFNGKDMKPVKQVADAWAKETGKNVKVIEASGDFNLLTIAIRSGKGPDMIVGVPQDQLAVYCKAGIVNNIPEGTIDKDKYIPQALNAASYESNLCAQPITIYSYGLFYNKDIIKNPPQNWDDIIQVGKEKGFKWDLSDLSEFSIVSKEQTIGNKFINEIFKDKLISRSDTGDIPRTLFLSKKVGLLVSGSGTIDSCKAQKLNFDVVSLPPLDGKETQIFSITKLTCVLQASSNKDLAWNFLKYSSEKLPKAIYDSQKSIPAIASLANSSEINKDPIYSKFVKIATK